MRAIVAFVALCLLSLPASAQSAQKVMYTRPPLAVLCDRLDYAKVAVSMASDAMRAGKAVRSYPRGCWSVRPAFRVVWLDQFDEYAYVQIGGGTDGPVRRAFVHVGALSDTPEMLRRRR
jgi:hypothetical protein